METNRCCADDPRVKEMLEKGLDDERIAMLEEERVDRCCDVLQLLSHPLRLKIAILLESRPHCVCELVTVLKAPQNLISHHLGLLRQGHVILPIMQSGWKYYMLNDTIKPLLREIIAWQGLQHRG